MGETWPELLRIHTDRKVCGGRSLGATWSE